MATKPLTISVKHIKHHFLCDEGKEILEDLLNPGETEIKVTIATFNRMVKLIQEYSSRLSEFYEGAQWQWVNKNIGYALYLLTDYPYESRGLLTQDEFCEIYPNGHYLGCCEITPDEHRRRFKKILKIVREKVK